MEPNSGVEPDATANHVQAIYAPAWPVYDGPNENRTRLHIRQNKMEPAEGIEPSPTAYKTVALP